MTEAEKKAEELRKKDAEILARRKKKFDAARFDHIEKTNKIHGQPKPQESRPEPPRAAPEKEDTKKKKWSLFKKKPKEPAKTASASSSSSVAGANESSASQNTKVKPPPPIAVGSVKPDFHSTQHEIAPNWASVDQKNELPQPSVGHSSDACYPRPPSAAAIPTHVPTNKRPDRPALPQYNTVGYGTAGRSTNNNNNNNNNNNTGISSTIAAFQAGAAKPKTGDPRQMKQPKVSSSTSETMDPRGNITRTITRTITEPNGNVRTETQVVEIPAER